MRRLAAALLLLWLGLAPAEARVIGILFDDSGSMSGRIQLPAFGAQLLVSTLDGRAGGDRLVTARMSQLGAADEIEPLDISTTAAQQQAIDRIATDWPVPHHFTPYQQIEGLLAAIADRQQPGEPAYLVILTDGAFNTPGPDGEPAPPPPAEEMRRRFLAAAARLSGPLRVDFLLIGAGEGDTGSEVERQGIRRALLEIFNGNADDGRYDIGNSAELTETIKDIVARVAGTDRRGQTRFLQPSASAIALDSPLSITRIVAVAAGAADGALPHAGAPSFPTAERIDLTSRMRGEDVKGAWARERLAGLATHLLLQPPLPAGHYEVPFDRPPDDVFLLFQTAAGLRLGLRGADGAPLQADGGVYRLSRGSPATLVLEVVDSVGGQLAAVPLSRLGDATSFSAELTLGGARRPLAPAADGRGEAALAAVPTETIGRGTIEASMRIAGFVTTYATPLAVEIVEVDGTVGVALAGSEDCPDCGSGEVRYTVTAAPGPHALARVAVSAAAPLDGRLEVSLDGPDWLALADAAGAPPGALAVQAGVPLRAEMTVVATGGAAALSAGSATGFTVRAALAGGPAGSAEAKATVRLVPAEAQLLPRGQAAPAAGSGPVPLGLDHLGEQPLAFELVDALDPAEAGTVAVEGGGWLLGFAPEAEGTGIAVRPRLPGWCDCLAFLDRGEHQVRVRWTGPGGLQSAEAVVPVLFEPGWSTVGWACARLLLLLAAIAYLVWGLIVWRSAVRFPKGSGVSIFQGRQDLPIYRQLRRFDWTFLRAMLAPFRGRPDEMRVVEGLALKAARGGALILLDRSATAFRIDTLGQTVAEFRRDNPNIAVYKLNWNDSVERRDGGLRRLTLLKRPDAQAR